MQHKTDLFSKRLTPAQIAYLLHQFVPEAHYVGGSEDLRCLLPQLNLSNIDDEAFIFIRPLIHSMPLYLRVIDNNEIIAYLGDSQGWHQRYYPTRDIIKALQDYFPDIQIVLSTT